MAAWQADTRFSTGGREVVGAAIAWRQADACCRTPESSAPMLSSPLLRMIETGEFIADRNTVLVLDEVSQIGPRPPLQLLQLQARTGMTIKNAR